MGGTITGLVLNDLTRDPISTPRVSLTGLGIAGEILTDIDQQGRFAFNALSPGRYSIGFYDDRYAPLYHHVVLEEGASFQKLQFSLVLGAFLAGRILDEDGIAPERCYFTLIREGRRADRSGFICDSGDHDVNADGSFSSPPLHAGQYCLRFAGLLQNESNSILQTTCTGVHPRFFDFIYPDVTDVTQAKFFDLKSGESVVVPEIRIPRPIWRRVRGRLTGALPIDLTNIFVDFMRDAGTIDDFGSAGVRVDSGGAFSGPAQPGRYTLFVSEYTDPDQHGRVKVTRRLGSAEISVEDRDVDEVEIEL